LLVIRNPAAGRGRARLAWPGIARSLAASGIEFDEVETQGRGEAMVLAERGARRYAGVVAVGGDGTVHEVVNGLLRAATGTTGGAVPPGVIPLGVIPSGSGDDFAKLLPPGDPVERLARRSVRRFDAGRIAADRVVYFANGMDVGFGAHAARNVALVPRFLTGLGAYLGALAITLVRYPALKLRMQLDGGPPFEQASTMTAVMNGRCFGGSFRVTPEASAEDGLLDLLLADRVGRARILALVPRIMRGAHAGEPELRLLRARKVVVESEEPLVVEADGEIVLERARRLEIEVLPGALPVFA
jgi:diacylglycerol kinase family enzyme